MVTPSNTSKAGDLFADSKSHWKANVTTEIYISILRKSNFKFCVMKVKMYMDNGKYLFIERKDEVDF